MHRHRSSPSESRACARSHRLWWTPRAGHGRGIVFASGRVCTWPEAEAEHRQVARVWHEREGERARMFFSIRPDGRVRIPARHALAAGELAALLSAADERLRAFVPGEAAPPGARAA